MFQSTSLNNYLKTSNTIENENAIFVEWNMNIPENFERIGNYYYRPGSLNAEDLKYSETYRYYEYPDIGNYYTGATEADVVLDAGYEDDGTPLLFTSTKQKINMLYSLEDCLGMHRPRSGINKLLYLGSVGAGSGYNQYIDSLYTFKTKSQALITGAISTTVSIEGTSYAAVTYSAQNNFQVGEYVKISGISPSQFNQSDLTKIIQATADNFTIIKTVSGTYSNGGVAELGYLSSTNIARRPRYYMSSRFDQFKYWTSYRTKGTIANNSANNNEYGISRGNAPGGGYYIYDASPFVVYKENVPANRIVVKMQTNVGEINNGPYRMANNNSVSDPLYGDNNKTTPLKWRIQILKNNEWITAKEFLSDQVPISGHVEIAYGISNIPSVYANNFLLVGTKGSTASLPAYAPIGYAYLIKTGNDKGVIYVSNGADWESFIPQYGWEINSEEITRSTNFVKKLVNPDKYVENSKNIYREFELIRGIRVVVETMKKFNSTFDLIEMSPRLVADMTDRVMSFSITKTLSDLGNNTLPVGNLFASVGSLNIFDDELAFKETNVFNESTSTGSIIAKYYDTQAKFLFYEIIKNVGSLNYFIPIKTMYSHGFPQSSDGLATISISIRDLYFLLESKKAPQILLTDVSLSYAITVLLDSIGFSNYVFKRLRNEKELIIPYFFVGPDQNVAEVLQQLAISSQTAMFFDEYNNFVVMYKGYLIPEQSQRPIDYTISGQTLQDGQLPNIINISAQNKAVYNGGQISYTTRYIQKSLGSINQAPYTDEYKTYVYKPVLLWEVAPQQQKQTINELGAQSAGYSLAAAPLNTDLSNNIPVVSASGIVLNNIIDLGESVYWLGNYAGYLYANGEIIRYDAIEYSVQGIGKVWIKNNHEYQDYFSKLKFNGKMYPTGNIRIYCEPQYNETTGAILSGEVKEHGRGQFGTTVTNHIAGFTNDQYWTNPNDTYVRGCIQDAKNYLFNNSLRISYPNNMIESEAGNVKKVVVGGNVREYNANNIAISSKRNGIIKNFLANKNDTELEISEYKTTKSGSIQSSALVFNGPTVPDIINGANFVSYVYKEMNKPYRHFGTRMRIVGKIESGTNKSQTPNGGYLLFNSNSISSNNPSDDPKIIGGSGGIAFGLNKNTNVGYYFEIVALSSDSVSNYTSNDKRVSFSIASSPVVLAQNDLVTVTTTSQHSLEVGDSIIISGLLDDTKRDNTTTRLNGKFTVTAIGNNKKTFQYQIPAPSSSSMTVAKAVGDGTSIKYRVPQDIFAPGYTVTVSGLSPTSLNKTNIAIDSVLSSPQTLSVVSASGNGSSVTYNVGTHDIVVGQTVRVRGVTPSAYNWESVVVSGISATTFSISSNVTQSYASGGTVTGTKYEYVIQDSTVASDNDGGGTMTYVPLSVNSSTGGTVSKTVDTSGALSNIFFYKVLAGQNISEFYKKSFTKDDGNNGNVVLTTIKPHSFVVGDRVTIAGSGNDFMNGEKSITTVTENTITYRATNASNVSEVEVNPIGTVTGIDKIAIPEVLWKGLTEVIVDDGKFTGQSRFANKEKTTVYDLSAEYINIGSTRRFFLYLNGKQIAVVDDTKPLTEYNNMALFVRGGSRCMFENLYALMDTAENTGRSLQKSISKIPVESETSLSEEILRNYGINNLVRTTFLNGISSQEYPKYDIYYEEFGTIMREVAYFNIRYDRAFPALYAKIAETANRSKAYAISGLFAGAYGAEFLIFNCMDKNINLDDTSGNYLRMLGIAFTQNTTYNLTVDDYFNKMSNLSDPQLVNGGTSSAIKYKKLYTDIKNSRVKYGLNEFSLETPYIQTTTAAEQLLDWIILRTMQPRRSVGVLAFGCSHLQLGDLVNINYKSNNIDVISDIDSTFVIYNIEYSKEGPNIQNTIYLAEV